MFDNRLPIPLSGEPFVEVVMRKKLERCINCTREGHPYLIADGDEDVWYFYVECLECTDDVVFYGTETEAMKAYKKKYHAKPDP